MLKKYETEYNVIEMMDMKINKRAKILAVIMCLAMVFSGCTAKTSDADNVKTSNSDKGVYVLYTSDVHCAIEGG